ncbi:MAG: hypothetical protein ACWA5T_01490 [Parvularcula sp.]
MILKGLCAAASLFGVAAAQSMTPMKADIVTFSDRAAVRVYVRNPYARAQRFDMEVYDPDGRISSDALISSQRVSLAPGAQSSVLVITPLQGQPTREVIICATSMPFYGSGNGVRGQVCGNYRIIQRRS